jgi:thiol:disulfide interchange protein
MEAAGARILGDEEQQLARGKRGLSLVEPEDREAVLMQWERKIEQAERGGRFEREAAPRDAASEAAAPADATSAAATADEALRRGARFERSAPIPAVATPAPAVAQRRTVTITGQPTPARRRASLAERHIAAQPDRIALWAFLLGLLLIAVAAGTAHA